MHTQTTATLRHFLAEIDGLGAPALNLLQAAIDRRRAALGRGSTILERRGHGLGLLQLETRAYVRKDGRLKERGPYWYFHYREGGRQKTLYVGKTDAPEAVLDEKLKRKE